MLSPTRTIIQFRTPLLVVFGLVLLAKGAAFLSPLYSVDGWIEATLWDEGGTNYTHFLTQYRFGLAALQWVFRQFEYSGIQVAFSAIFLACGLSAVASLFAYLLLDPSARRTPYLIFATVYCLHPFTTEIFTFIDVTLFVCLSLALGQIGAFLVARGCAAREWIVGAALIVASLSIYQLTLHYILITLLFAGVAAQMRGDSLKPVIRTLSVAVLSAALCLAIGKGVNTVLQIPSEGRGNLMGIAEIPARIGVLWNALTLAFYPPPHLVPRVATWAASAAIAVSLASSLWAVVHRRGTLSAALVGLALAGALFWVAGLAIVGSVVWLVPRVLSAVAVFIGGLLALGWLAGHRPIQRGVAACVAILAFAYVSADNRILFDQWRVNQWDIRQANRIIARLEALPEFSNTQTVVMRGGRYRHSAPLPTAFGDLSLTALAPGLAHYTTFQQATGYDLRSPSPEETGVADTYCKTAPKWPAAQAVTIIGAAGVVCLPD